MLSSNQASESVRRLVPFPSFGYLDADGLWRLNVSGIVRQPYSPSLRKRMLIHFLGNVMHASDEDLLNPMFRERVTSFVMDGAHGLDVSCRIGDRTFELPRRTRRNGHYSSWLALEPSFLERHVPLGPLGLRKIDVRIRVDQNLEESAAVYLIPRRGWSVISDIDDTIKESAIGDRRELLANTFLRDFRAVHGMAEIYQAWSIQGMPVHYVSSSPWQLLPWIDEMIQRHEFPCGSLHLRNFRLRTHMLQKVIRFRRSGKAATIRLLLRKFPQRRFLLIGDSSEKDLEIYGKIARRSPGQIGAILIRNVPHHPLEAERLTRCQMSLEGVQVNVFDSPQTLAAQAGRLLERESRPGSALASPPIQFGRHPSNQ